MSRYFVTGATGFLGRRLVHRLVERPDCEVVHVLVRAQSRHRVAELFDSPRVVAVVGDLTADGLGIHPLPDPPDHVLHLGAIYDFTADDAEVRAVNVTGTRNVVAFAAATGARWLHHVSSIAVAGDHSGWFAESDFQLGQNLTSPYHETKFAAERIVREESAVAYRVYRPAVVVGDSGTGEMDKADGPYYFLPAISRLARLPSRIRLPGVVSGRTNIVPVDYVVAAMDHLIHADAAPGSTYHLAAPRSQPLHEVYNAFARAAGAPKMLPTPVPDSVRGLGRRTTNAIDRLPRGRAARHAVLSELGVPPQVLPHLHQQADFDTTATREALRGTGLEVPRFADYAGKLYDYWHHHLDPDRARCDHPRGRLHGRRVLITGASSGIGRATALEVARRGGIPLLVARRADRLDEVAAEVAGLGARAATYPCDLSDPGATDALVKQVLAEHDGVDMLVNNAGRSIRRSVQLATDRMHDYERTMALNYFAAVRLTLGLLDHMRQRRFGHVVNVTTQGLQAHTPRFSAYLASKAALEEFGRSAGRDTLADGITFSSVRLPLVRTEMAGETDAWRGFPHMSAKTAARYVVRALEERPEIVNVGMPPGTAAEIAARIAPRTIRAVAHLAGYQAMRESAPEARDTAHPGALPAVAGAVTRLFWRRLRSRG
ncbi:SDR family oxidoreductase [Saccharopolyspora taberi]|uniref:SDR family oxidoreductase n=1 Tax=Saccharopolyspora taberi TaxID=60895 RepID=A0ABN3V212_9PSEU